MQISFKICGLGTWVWKISWRRAWQLTPVFLSGEPHRQRSLVGYSIWGYTELDTTEAALAETSSSYSTLNKGFPGGSEVKASVCNAGDLGSIPGSGRSPGQGTGNPLQYSCLENPMDGEALWTTVHRVTKSQTRLSDFTTNKKLLYHSEF